MSIATRKNAATNADLVAVPSNMVAKIMSGELVTHPRPSPKHARASSALGSELYGPFDRGRGGPGGWIVLDGSELHLGVDVVTADLAGWRRERMPSLPETAHFEVPPDWVCEVVSPSTVKRDRAMKRRIYASTGASYFWLLDPQAEVLETFALHDGICALTDAFSDADEVVAAPFEAIGSALSELWPSSHQTPQTGAEAPVADET